VVLPAASFTVFGIVTFVTLPGFLFVPLTTATVFLETFRTLYWMFLTLKVSPFLRAGVEGVCGLSVEGVSGLVFGVSVSFVFGVSVSFGESGVSVSSGISGTFFRTTE